MLLTPAQESAFAWATIAVLLVAIWHVRGRYLHSHLYPG
jgi:hypothetical protein